MNISNVLLNGILLGLFELIAFWGYDLVRRKFPLGWAMVLLRSIVRVYVIMVIGYHAMIIPLILIGLLEGRAFWEWWKDYKNPSPF